MQTSFPNFNTLQKILNNRVLKRYSIVLDSIYSKKFIQTHKRRHFETIPLQPPKLNPLTL